MSLSAERYIKKVGPLLPEVMQVGVDASAAKIWEGAMVTTLTATGMAVRAGTGSAGPVVGVAAMTVDASAGGSDGDYSINLMQGCFWFDNGSATDACSEATIGKLCYAYDDHTVYDNDASATLKIAGVVIGYSSELGVLVFISAPMNVYFASSAATTLTEALAAITNGNGASLVGIEDAGVFTAAATVEAALAELYQHNKSIQKQVNIPLSGFFDADGDPLVKFVSESNPTMGTYLTDSKAFGLRWNNDSVPGAAWTSLPMPQDLDDTAAVNLHLLASKTGATTGDATTFLVEGYFQTVGALHDADANVGGTTNAMTGNATAKTVAELTLAISAADVPPSPSVLSFSLKPTNGTLGTDDVIVEGAWLEYKGKVLTA